MGEEVGADLQEKWTIARSSRFPTSTSILLCALVFGSCPSVYREHECVCRAFLPVRMEYESLRTLFLIGHYKLANISADGGMLVWY